MNVSGRSQIAKLDAAAAALRDAIVIVDSMKAVALRPLSHLLIWVSQEQSVRE